MDDWDSEDTQIPPIFSKDVIKSKWDDEDVDEDDVKDSWEDEDKPEPDLVTIPAAVPKKISGPKSSDNKGKAVELKNEAPLDPIAEKLDPIAEKLRQQRLVEEADYKSTTELFGKRGDEKTLDNFIPKSESDFFEYAELISHKLRSHEKSYHYISLIKDVMRLSMTTLKAADAKDVASSISAIANEKLKLEKETSAGKKKTGAKKKQLQMDKPDDDLVVNSYDDVEDFDFM